MHLVKDFGTLPNGNTFHQLSVTIDGEVYAVRAVTAPYADTPLSYIYPKLKKQLMSHLEKVVFND